MSAIPPNLVGPILQAPTLQGQVSSIRENEDAQRAVSERRQTGALTQADSTVETTDNDTAVYSDAEGTGSQGRAFSQPEEAVEPEPPTATSEDADAHHIDIEA